MSTGMLPLTGAILAGILALFLAPLIFRETRRARAIDRRLAVLRGQAVTLAPVLDPLDRRDGGRVFSAMGLAVLRVFSMVVPIGAAEREKLAQMLRKGGFGQPEALSVFLSIKLASGLALSAGFGVFAAGSEMIGQYSLGIAMAALVGFIVGGIFPEYGLRAKVGRRVRKMQSALPDALDMMVMCLETGLTVERGIMTVAEELMPIEPNLAREFRQIEAEIRVGADRRAVLEDYHRRTEIEGLADFAMALIQSDRYGTPLSQSMKSIASDERQQRAARVATQAERLPVLMTLPMLIFVVPGTMFLVAGPGFLGAMSALSSFAG